MSAESRPITPTRFAAALQELPLSSLYGKRAEIENSVAHLDNSNQELQKYADEGDAVCIEAIDENVEVIKRMRERVELLKAEVEKRGLKWEEDKGSPDSSEAIKTNGEAQESTQRDGNRFATSREGGSLGDDELARRLARQLDEDEGGLHL